MFGLFGGNKNDNSLKKAIVEGDLDEVNHRLHEKTDAIDTTDNDGNTALHLAIENDQEQIVELLISHEADVNRKNYKGVTPLHIAARQGNIHVVRLLLTDWVEVNSQDNLRFTPLHYAAQAGKLEVVKILVEHGAYPEMRAGMEDINVLHMAAGSISEDNPLFIESIKYLVSHGADINSGNRRNETLLHLAAMEGKPETIIFLMEKGADVNAGTVEGDTPLHYVMRKERKDMMDIFKILIGNKADLNAVNNDNNTPLHIAAIKGLAEVAGFLLEFGANPDIRGTFGRISGTPLDYALHLKQLQIAEILNKYGGKTAEQVWRESIKQ